MRLRVSLGVALACLVGFPRLAASASPAYHLDTKTIHSVYLDGDFEKGIELIELFLYSGKPMSHDDSVFSFKHLGVMYSASENTRDKGRQFLLDLLALEPSAKLSEMGASESMEALFKGLKRENVENSRRRRAGIAIDSVSTTGADGTGDAGAPVSGPGAAPQSNGSGSSRVWWIAGGAAGVALIGAVIFVAASDDAPKKQTIVVRN